MWWMFYNGSTKLASFIDSSVRYILCYKSLIWEFRVSYIWSSCSVGSQTLTYWGMKSSRLIASMQEFLNFFPTDYSKGRAAALISLTGSLFYSSGTHFNFFKAKWKNWLLWHFPLLCQFLSCILSAKGIFRYISLDFSSYCSVSWC